MQLLDLQCDLSIGRMRVLLVGLELEGFFLAKSRISDVFIIYMSVPSRVFKGYRSNHYNLFVLFRALSK